MQKYETPVDVDRPIADFCAPFPVGRLEFAVCIMKEPGKPRGEFFFRDRSLVPLHFSPWGRDLPAVRQRNAFKTPSAS